MQWFWTRLTFISIGAVTFAIVTVILMAVVALLTRIIANEIKRAVKAYRLRQARKKVLEENQMRIAGLIKNKAYEEDFLRFMSNLERELRDQASRTDPEGKRS